MLYRRFVALIKIILLLTALNISYSGNKLVFCSIMDKKVSLSNFNNHNYISYSPYWWPDPNKPDGLPYIKKDGIRNVDLVKQGDAGCLKKTIDNIINFSKEYKVTKDKNTADIAVRFLNLWFLDNNTSMEPNLNYAQVRLGVNNNQGESSGIVEFRYLISLLEVVPILLESKSLSEGDYQKFKDWLEKYFTWLTNSNMGIEASKLENNHHTWYNAQVLAIALFLNKQDYVEKIIEDTKSNIIAKQIEPDGKQPLELTRTRSLTYSLFNLEALFIIAKLAQKQQSDLLNFKTKDGCSILTAYNFILVYKDKCSQNTFTENCTWGNNYKQIDPVESWRWNIIEKNDEILSNIVQ